MKNWKTTLAGLILAIATLAGQSGIKVGHVGNSDVVSITQAVAAVILGAYAKDEDSQPDPKK